MSSSGSRVSPAWTDTGTRSPRPVGRGCSSERTAETTTRSGPSWSAWPGCASRRSTASRWPTVSLRGLNRSCGSVSQLGKTATLCGGSRERRLAARSSASRPVAVATRTTPPVGSSSRAMTAAAQGRTPGTAVRSTSRSPRWWISSMLAREGSSRTWSSRPESGGRSAVSRVVAPGDAAGVELFSERGVTASGTPQG